MRFVWLVMCLYIGCGLVWACRYWLAMQRALRGEPAGDPDIPEVVRLIKEESHLVPTTLLLVVVGWPYFRFTRKGRGA